MTTYKYEEINAQEAIEQLQNAKDLIQINGKDYFDIYNNKRGGGYAYRNVSKPKKLKRITAV